LALSPLAPRTDAPTRRLRDARTRSIGRILVVARYCYVISYRIAGDTVEVRYVFHPRQAR
jgi:hypothetical protein